MSCWYDELVQSMTGTQVKVLREDWRISVLHFATLFGVNPSTIHRWEKRGALTFPVERGSRRILAVLHLLRADGDVQALVREFLRAQRDIDALHLLLQHAVRHEAVLRGEVDLSGSIPNRRSTPVRPKARPLSLRDFEDDEEGTQVDDEHEETDEAPKPAVPREYLVEALVLGRWSSYGKQTKSTADAMAAQYARKNIQCRVTYIQAEDNNAPADISERLREVDCVRAMPTAGDVDGSGRSVDALQEGDAANSLARAAE